MDVRKYEMYFECSPGYLTSKQSEQVRYPVQHRDVRYEKIPVSVYRKKYTGNTGIPVIPVYRYFGLVKSWVLLDLQNHEMDEKSQNIEL